MSRNKRFHAVIVLLIIASSVFQWVQNVLVIDQHVEKDERPTIEQMMIELPPNKPVLYYHPGPPKMGTTSLQCALTRHQLDLQQDGHVFAGKVPTKFCPGVSLIAKELSCLTQQQQQQQQQQQSCGSHASMVAMKRTIDTLHQKRMNIILSDETHSMFQNNHDKTPLLSDLFSNWTKHLIIGYRHYWQFWLSSRHEYNRVSSTRGTKDWTGRELQSIPQMLRDEIATRDYFSPFTRNALDLYSHYNFDKITILNIHDHDDFVQYFLCSLLKAPNTCRHYRPMPKFNPSASTEAAADMDRLVMLASRSIINTTKYSRWHAVNFTMNSKAHPPIVAIECPSDMELQALFTKSRQEEDRIFSNRKDFQDQNQSFWKTSFCAVDVIATLQNVEWRQFFQRHFG